MNKLYRIRKGKIFFGVCGGLAKCFNVDAKIVRLLFTVTVFVFQKSLLHISFLWLLYLRRLKYVKFAIYIKSVSLKFKFHIILQGAISMGKLY